MKLKDAFISCTAGDDVMLIPIGGAGRPTLVRGNKTFGVILDLLKTDTTEPKIVAAMCARFDAPETVIAGDVKRVLAELRRVSALEE